MATERAYRDSDELVTAEEVTPEEERALFNKAAQYYLGIDGDEFVRRWDRGYYDDDPDRDELTAVAILLPLAR